MSHGTVYAMWPAASMQMSCVVMGEFLGGSNVIGGYRTISN